MNKYFFAKIAKYFATLGPIGYAPAPGTIASFITLPVAAILLKNNVSSLYYGLIIVATCTLAWFVIDYALPLFGGDHDPSAIVIDEVCGCLITFYGIHQFSWITLIAGFMLFRFFDIIKPLGIAQFEAAPGAWGILLDDVLAGIYSIFCLSLFINLLP